MEFELPKIDFTGIFEEDADKRYNAPCKIKSIPDRFVVYDNALRLATDINFELSKRWFVIINGDFFFGDFFEALHKTKGFHFEDITLSTLTLNENNVDSFANLLHWGVLDSLNFLISDYFYENEKFKLIPYIYQELDINDSFQLAVSRTHCKITLLKTKCGEKIVVHGSANLRSSDNIEQICIEENEELYDYCKKWHDEIIQVYKTINKKIKRKELWQILEKEGEAHQVGNHQLRDKDVKF